MRDLVRKLCSFGLLALSLAILLAASPLFSYSARAATPRPHTKGGPRASTASHPQPGVVTTSINVRSQASITGPIVATYPPGTTVTIYATVRGQAVWDNNTTWDRISKPGSAPRYVYAALIAPAQVHTVQANSTRAPTRPARLRSSSPSSRGKEIVVSLSRQWMFVYDKGVRVYDSPVTTGQPALSTPTGTYHVLSKLSPTTFHSPWPPGSPYWYPDTHINYALEWKQGGYFLHDAWWRSVYGPGTNVYHYDPVDGWMSGTHGCVTVPLSAAIWLYNWAPIGTTVRVEP